MLTGAERGARNSCSVASLSSAKALSRRGSFEDQSWNRRRWGTQKIHKETNALGGLGGFAVCFVFFWFYLFGGCALAIDFFLEKLADTLPTTSKETECHSPVSKANFIISTPLIFSSYLDLGLGRDAWDTPMIVECIMDYRGARFIFCNRHTYSIPWNLRTEGGKTMQR